MVATGQLDALLETLPVGAHIVREKSLTNIRVVPRPIYSLPQHIGVRKGEPLLLSIVQKGLDSVTETERSTVLTASDGLQAVALYRERGKEIDLVLMDLTMPHMDGAEVLAGLLPKRLGGDG